MKNNYTKIFIIALLIIPVLSVGNKTAKITPDINPENNKWSQEDKNIKNPKLQILLEQLKRDFSSERDALEKDFKMRLESLKDEYAEKQKLLKSQYKRDKPLKLNSKGKEEKKEITQNKKVLPTKKEQKNKND